jgi:hypothetical protein
MPYIDMLDVAMGVAVVLAVVFTGAAVLEGFDREAFNDHQQAAEAWCSEHGGELAYGDGMGVHAQTHCYIEDGTAVHMGEIATMDYTHDWERIRGHRGATHANTPLLVPLTPTKPVFGSAVLIALLVGIIGVVQRARKQPTEESA